MNKQELKEEVGKLNLVVAEFEADGMCYMDKAVSVTQVYDLIDQLDELKVLSQEWIDNNVVHIRGLGDIFEAVAVESLLVSKKGLPVIPQFVSDWWEGDSVTMYGGEIIDKKRKIHLISNFNDRGLGDHLSKVEDWIDENESTFLDLVNGKPYEVEKEKLYYVELPNTNSKSESLYLAQGNVSGDYWFNSRLERLDYEAGACKHKFTEKEIKDYDERYWQFAVEVEE